MTRTVDAGDALEIGREAGATVLTFMTPILSLEVLDELTSTLEALSTGDGRRPLILRSAHPGDRDRPPFDCRGSREMAALEGPERARIH